MVDLLVARGARHHVFTAIALGDVDLLRRVVEDDPKALSRRLSRFEQEQTPLHYVIAPADGLRVAPSDRGSLSHARCPDRTRS